MRFGAAKWIASSALALFAGFVVGSLAAAPQAQAAPAPKQARTSFHFDNIPVRSALQILAEEGNFNLVVSDSVQGNISLRLNDVTWEQALDLVLRIKGLRQRVDGQTRTVAAAGA